MENQIKQIEEILNIKLERYVYAQEQEQKEQQKNLYTIYSGKLEKLTLRNTHIEDINVLLPISENLKSLKLSNCTIGNISGLINFKLREIKFDNITIRNSEQISEMVGKLDSIYAVQLSNMHIENINILLPFSKLYSLAFINCTIGNMSGFINFRIRQLYFDNVTIRDIEEITTNTCKKLGKEWLQTVRLTNINIKNISVLLPISQSLQYMYLTNCQISNFYEFNLFPKLHSLTLDKVTINQTSEDIYHAAMPRERSLSLRLENIDIKNIDFFAPISEGLESLNIKNCRIGNINGIYKFPKILNFSIDSETSIEDSEVIENEVFSSKRISCSITASEKPFNLQKLVPIAASIDDLHFDNYNIDAIECIGGFSNLKEISFSKSKVYLNNFLPVAKQITCISFHDSTIKKSANFRHFKQLEKLEIDTNNPKTGIKHFKKLLPLKNQLKKLRISEEKIKGLELLKQFTVLESLELNDVSTKAAKSIFSLNTLKNVSIYISTKREHSFNLKEMKSIEKLTIYNSSKKVSFEGFGYLKHLEWLDLDCECKAKGIHKLKKLRYLDINESMNINDIQAIKTLKTLIIDAKENKKIRNLERFVNLEKLKIRGTNKITLGKLEKLKVLDIGNIYPKNLDCLENLPSLEKLYLGDNDLTEIKSLDKLTNLKWLDLQENYTLKSLEGLEKLQSLEYLNLYENEISDVHLLNQLPNLKEVNLAQNSITEEQAKEQLERPEIAAFYYLPSIPFIIWKTEYFKF